MPGFLPIIGIYIETHQDIRLIQSTLIDSLKNLDDWVLYDIRPYLGVSNLLTNQDGIINKSLLKIYITPEEVGEKIEKKKSTHHKKINAFFNEYFTDLKKHGYKIIIDKVFEKDGRIHIKHPEGWQVKKLYLVVLEKVYNINLKMIDDLAEVKQCLETCFQKLSDVEDFYDVNYHFEMETHKSEEGKKIKVIFSISAYEK